MSILPNFIIIGAPKCGTTSVFKWLKDHPQVCGSSRKEVQYFMDRESSVYREESNFLDHGMDRYSAYFSNFDSQIHKVIIEATPGYIYQRTAINEMGNALKSTTFIVILREPVSRLLSIYNYFSQNRGELNSEISFTEFINLVNGNDISISDNEFLRDAIRHGQYVHYLKQWRDKCGSDKIKVFLYEDLIYDSQSFIKSICELMGIKGDFYDNYDFKSHNRSVVIKNRMIHNLISQFHEIVPSGKLRDHMKSIYFRINSKSGKNKGQSKDGVLMELSKIYYSSNKELSELFGLDLSAWKGY